MNEAVEYLLYFISYGRKPNNECFTAYFEAFEDMVDFLRRLRNKITALYYNEENRKRKYFLSVLAGNLDKAIIQIKDKEGIQYFRLMNSTEKQLAVALRIRRLKEYWQLKLLVVTEQTIHKWQKRKVLEGWKK